MARVSRAGLPGHARGHRIGAAQRDPGLLIFDGEGVGSQFVKALQCAQARGVRVRVLVDDVCARWRPGIAYKVLKRTGVPVAFFNPTLIPARLHAAHLRNHRKLLVVDGQTGFTGGMNIFSPYWRPDTPGQACHDLHFWVQGPVVAQLMQCLADDWCDTTGERLDLDFWGTFEERLRREWLHIKRNPEQKTVVAICDIDHFKKINDTHGHQCGDEVLKHFSTALAQNIRGNDLAAPIGGEEFAILLHDTSIADSKAWANRFRKTIAESTLSYNNTALTYTTSIGLAHLEGGLDSPDEAVKRADEALYRANNNGRNQVVFAGMENDDE